MAHTLSKVCMACRAISGLQEPSYNNLQVSSLASLPSGLITELKSANASIPP